MSLRPALALPIALSAAFTSGVAGLTVWIIAWESARPARPALLWLLRKAGLAGVVGMVMVMAAVAFGLSLAALTGTRVVWGWLAVAAVLASLLTLGGFALAARLGFRPVEISALPVWIGAATALALRTRVVAP